MEHHDLHLSLVILLFIFYCFSLVLRSLIPSKFNR